MPLSSFVIEFPIAVGALGPVVRHFVRLLSVRHPSSALAFHSSRCLHSRAELVALGLPLAHLARAWLLADLADLLLLYLSLGLLYILKLLLVLRPLLRHVELLRLFHKHLLADLSMFRVSRLCERPLAMRARHNWPCRRCVFLRELIQGVSASHCSYWFFNRL